MVKSKKGKKRKVGQESKSSDLICGMDAETARRYVAMRKETDLILHDLECMADLLRACDGEALATVSMCNETLSWLGRFISVRALNIISGFDDGFASSLDVQSEMERVRRAIKLQ